MCVCVCVRVVVRAVAPANGYAAALPKPCAGQLAALWVFASTVVQGRRSCVLPVLAMADLHSGA